MSTLKHTDHVAIPLGKRGAFEGVARRHGRRRNPARKLPRSSLRTPENQLRHSPQRWVERCDRSVANSETPQSVRASSHSTKQSNRSDFPPEARKRSRAALTWLGCSANTCTPASSSRSTSTPSGRSIATTSTSKHTNASHNAVIPLSSCANVSPSNALPASSAIRTSCFSDAQSIPAQLPTDPPSGRFDKRPDLEVPLRVLIDKALNGATSCRRSRHLTTGGRGWSFAGPRQGQAIVALSRRWPRQTQLDL